MTDGKRTPLEPKGRRQTDAGTRQQASERCVLRAGGVEIAGWSLNVSPGGVRIVIEQPVDPGAEYEVCVGEAPPRRGRVAWVQTEVDGQVVGVELLDAEGRPLPGGGFDAPDGAARRTTRGT